MKCGILIFGSIFCANTLLAQPYNFPDKNATWMDDFEYGCDIATGYGSLHVNTYHLISDTLINGVAYNKLYSATNNYYLPDCLGTNTPTFYEPTDILGYIRSDTITKRVYFLNKDSILEALLYSFSLQIGDTLPKLYNTPNNIEFAVVTGIDSVVSGFTYKEFIIQAYDSSTHRQFNSYSWLEGIGSTGGLFYLFTYDSTLSEGGGVAGLYCFSDSGNRSYPSGTECQVSTGIFNNYLSPIIFKLFPDPATNEITIEYRFNDWTAGDEVSLVIANIFGQTLYNQKALQHSGFQKIDISQYPASIYTAYTKRNGNLIATSKFAKE